MIFNLTDAKTSMIAYRAVGFLREKYNVHPEASIIDLFNSEFNCDVLATNDFGVSSIKFNTEEDYTLFLLKFA